MNDASWQWWVLRSASFLAGAAIVWGAAFLYESEEGLLENKLQDLFERLRTAGSGTVGRHLTFAVRLAEYASAVSDRAYGGKLLSVNAAATSIFIAVTVLAALLFTPGFDPLQRLFDALDGGDNYWSVISGLVLAAAVLTAALVTIVTRLQLRMLRLTVAAVVVVGVGALGLYAPSELGLLTFALAVVACNVFISAAMHRMLRMAARAVRVVGFVWLLVVSCLLVLVSFVLPPLAVYIILGNTVANVAEAIVLLQLLSLGLVLAVVPAAPVCVMGVLSVSLLIHRMIWPALLRPLYSFRRHRLLFEHRKASLAVGAYLIAAGLIPPKVNPEAVVRTVLKQFGVDVP